MSCRGECVGAITSWHGAHAIECVDRAPNEDEWGMAIIAVRHMRELVRVLDRCEGHDERNDLYQEYAWMLIRHRQPA